MKIINKNINDLVFAEYNPRELTKDQWEEKRYVPDGCISKIKYHYQVIYKVTNKE